MRWHDTIKRGWIFGIIIGRKASPAKRLFNKTTGKPKMKYIELQVRTAIVVHGYDSDNKEIEELVSEPDYVRKVISIDRILSISEQYVM
jgi:hypothetical protein